MKRLVLLLCSLLSACFFDSSSKQGGVIIIDNTVTAIHGQLLARQFPSDSGQLFLIDSTQHTKRSISTGADGKFTLDSIKFGNWQLLWSSPEEIAQVQLNLSKDTAINLKVNTQVMPIMEVLLPSEIKRVTLGGDSLSQDSLGLWKIPTLPNGTLTLIGTNTSGQEEMFQAQISNYQVQIYRISDHSLIQSINSLQFPLYTFANLPYVQWSSRKFAGVGQLADLSGHNHPLQFLGQDSTYLGLGFLNGNQIYFAGDSILPWTISNGSTYLQFWTFNQPKTDLAFPLIADEGRRMTVYWYRDSLYWYKNNDDLYQVLTVPFKWKPSSLVDLKLQWGANGMKIYSAGQLIGQNTITTPYQHSTRNWPHENDTYIGLYPFGTVAVETYFQNLNPLQGYFVQGAIAPDSLTQIDSIQQNDTLFLFNFSGQTTSIDHITNQSAIYTSPSGWQLPNEILKDSLAAGEVGVHFTLTQTPTGAYQAVVGNAGQRMAIYVNNTSLVWYKSLTNDWQTLTANVDTLVPNKDYFLQATWGPDGMHLILNGVKVAGDSSLTSIFQNSPRSTVERIVYAGYNPATTVTLPIGVGVSNLQVSSIYARVR